MFLKIVYINYWCLLSIYSYLKLLFNNIIVWHKMAARILVNWTCTSFYNWLATVPELPKSNVSVSVIGYCVVKKKDLFVASSEIPSNRLFTEDRNTYNMADLEFVKSILFFQWNNEWNIYHIIITSILIRILKKFKCRSLIRLNIFLRMHYTWPKTNIVLRTKVVFLLLR